MRVYRLNTFNRVLYFKREDGFIAFGNMSIDQAEKLFREGDVSTDIPDEYEGMGITHIINGTYLFQIGEGE